MVNSLRSLHKQVEPAFVIAEREVRDQIRDWRIIFPVLGLTIFFPFFMNFTARQILGFVQQYGADIIADRLVPFLLMIVGFFPISVSLVIALESFVGEKERGSIEPLLNTPLEDWQLYLGKLWAATVPPLLASYLGMTVYLVGLMRKGVTIPGPDLLILIVLLTSVQAVVMVAGAVVVSSQATSIRAANLLASFIIIPVALLIQGESVVMFWGDYKSLWWIVIGLVVLTVLLVRVGLAHFQREELLGREIDVLNIRWMLKLFWETFKGGASSLEEWYRHSLFPTVKGLIKPFIIVTLLAVVGFLAGIRMMDLVDLPAMQFSPEKLRTQLDLLLQNWPLFSVRPMLGIWWQNVRVLLLAMALGSISLGIFGVLPLFTTMGTVGFLFELLTKGGFPVGSFLLLILPHGVVEIPVAILATAAVLKAGAIIATPTTGKTVSEVMVISLAEWSKVMVGLVIPLLLIAAGIEAWATPRLMLLLFHL